MKLTIFRVARIIVIKWGFGSIRVVRRKTITPPYERVDEKTPT